jgi:hypothetical protein
MAKGRTYGDVDGDDVLRLLEDELDGALDGLCAQERRERLGRRRDRRDAELECAPVLLVLKDVSSSSVPAVVAGLAALV